LSVFGGLVGLFGFGFLLGGPFVWDGSEGSEGLEVGGGLVNVGEAVRHVGPATGLVVVVVGRVVALDDVAVAGSSAVIVRQSSKGSSSVQPSPDEL
jgi:hypothetical protein